MINNNIYVGTVVKNDDRLSDDRPYTGKIKVSIPMIYGDIIVDDLPWCEPCFPYCENDTGFFFIPEIGSKVLVVLVNNSIYKPIWLGCIYRDSDSINPPKTIEKNYPNRKTLKTKIGYIVFDDKDETMEIKHKNGSEIIFKQDGDIVIHSAKNIIMMSDNIISFNPTNKTSVTPIETNN